MLEKGLSEAEAQERLLKYGYNEIKDKGKDTWYKILFRQVKGNVVVYFLVAAIILAYFIGESETVWGITGALIVIVIIGFVQEYKAEEAMYALKKIVPQKTIVIRDGKEKEIPTREVVVGDIVLLNNGEKIPADCLVLESVELRVNESVLTGESKDVSKTTFTKGEPTEENKLSMGTFIVGGRCTAKVVTTGMSTNFGKIAGMISKEEKELPLQKKVANMATLFVIIGSFFAVLTGIIMVFHSETLDKAFIIEVTIAVIAICVTAFPEDFPVSLICTLSAGAYRMSKKNAIVNRMSIIETLGETTVICSDKTGTLTKGEMTVKKMFYDGRFIEVSGTGYASKGSFTHEGKEIDVTKDKLLKNIMNISVLCNDSKITPKDEEFEVRGSPTEIALLVAAAKAGITPENTEGTRTDEIPFSSERKMMSVACKVKNAEYVYVKGAPEFVLQRCHKYETSHGVFTLTAKEKKKIMDGNSEMSKDAYRTLAIAYKKRVGKGKENFEKDLIFLGLVGMEDPPREEVIQAIKDCFVAGIKVKMITGDNKETAASVARQIGLSGDIITGDELDKMDEEKFSQLIDNTVIFARVKPEHKLKIVDALKKKGEIVAMTGDGVNDAPAVKAAHVGVAMGKNGTDVTREVSDLIVKDDNFATIVTAVGEGRTMLSNTRRFLSFEMSCIYAELAVIVLGVAIGLPLPLLALQILWLNLVTSDMPSITLGLTPHSPEVMKKKPESRKKLITRNLSYAVILSAILMSILGLGVYYYVLEVLGESVEVARSSTLLTLVFLEDVAAFTFVSTRGYFFSGKLFFKNKYLFIANTLSILGTVAIVYIPFFHGIFGTTTLALHDWIIAIGAALCYVLVFDVLKFFNNRKGFWKTEFD